MKKQKYYDPELAAFRTLLLLLFAALLIFWIMVTTSIDTFKNDLSPVVAFKRIPHSFIFDFTK